jgi:two-component system, LytTR family, sensor kinase
MLQPNWFLKFNITFWLIMCSIVINFFINDGQIQGALLLAHVCETLFYFVLSFFILYLYLKIEAAHWVTQLVLCAVLLVLAASLSVGIDYGVNYAFGAINYRYQALNGAEFPIQYSFFSTLIIFSLWLSAYLIVKKLLKSQLIYAENMRLNLQLSNAQLDILRGQINPHFMFNSLNNIRSLILHDQKTAREMVTHLSDMLRYSLNANQQEKTSIANELVIVKDFIALSKIQLDDRLQLNWQIDETCLQALMPPMMLQMLVENAIKHGISQIVGGGVLSIIINSQDDYVYLTVQNPNALTLVDPKESTCVGCNNIHDRLKLLYGQLACFELIEKRLMTEAIIKLPKEII